MRRQDLALEQKVLRGFKALKKPPRRILLALSGGVDSMVMAEILYKWRKGLGLELKVAHVHHGKSSSAKQEAYRQRTRNFVRRWAKMRQLPFFTNDDLVGPLEPSEEGLREFREMKLRSWLAGEKFEAIALAHHQDDLLETRLIRLIRGSGGQGLRAMTFSRNNKFRPLLEVSSEEIRTYAVTKKLRWVEDPSNQKPDILRNWLRREWLPSLETKRPGAVRSLARSLETLSPEVNEFDLAAHVGLRRESFVHSSSLLQRELLARYLKALGLKDYARTHVDEILKRLATERKNVEFEMLGLRFRISADFLWASRV